MSAYAAVVLDMDSTVAFVEGIDWLARRCDPAVARDIASLTSRAMDGELALDDIYGERLALIRPDQAEIEELALPRPILAVGDGSTDAALLPVVDTFAAFTGFVRRETVVAVADCELHSFDELLDLVLT